MTSAKSLRSVRPGLYWGPLLSWWGSPAWQLQRFGLPTPPSPWGPQMQKQGNEQQIGGRLVNGALLVLGLAPSCPWCFSWLRTDHQEAWPIPLSNSSACPTLLSHSQPQAPPPQSTAVWTVKPTSVWYWRVCKKLFMLLLKRTLFPSKVQMRDNSFAFLRGYLHFLRISKQGMK